MNNYKKISDYYAVLNDKRNIMNLVMFPGVATAECYYNLTEEDYKKIHKLMFDDHSGVTIAADGTISTYELPPPPKQPIKDQAQNALDDVTSQAPMIVAMGQAFGPKTQAYVQLLNAIINGTDTTTQELPVKPENLTE